MLLLLVTESHSTCSEAGGYQEIILYETSGSHSNGSIGPLFVVLAIIIILGLLAGLVSRVCGGRHWSGDTEYDFEGWVERRCANCIDGDVETGQPGRSDGGGDSGGDAKPVPNGSTATPAAPEPAKPEAKPASTIEAGSSEDKKLEGGGDEPSKPADSGGSETAATPAAEEPKPSDTAGDGASAAGS